MTLVARRHLPPRRAGRAARARDARLEPRPRRWHARSATPSASRPATAPSCTSRGDDEPPPSRRSSSSRASRSTGRSTGCTTRPLRCISSASPPASTRSSRARARSSARCARRYEAGDAGAAARPRLPPGAPASASACAPRRRSARARRRSPSAAAALAEQVFGDLAGRRVLLVGAGRIGELAAGEPLVARRARSRSSRTARRHRAARSPHAFGGAAIALEEVAGTWARSTSSSSSTSAPEHRRRAADVPARRRRPLFFIDIAVPRDVDPAITSSTAASSTTSTTSRRSSPRRSPAVARRPRERSSSSPRRRSASAEWQASLEVVPAIASLRARAEEIRAAELAKRRGPLSRRRAADARVGDGADPEQAPAPADGAA